MTLLEYCILIEGEFDMAYLRDLKRLPFKVIIRRIESELPAFLIVKCAENYVRYLYNNFLWIKHVEREDPMPVFWNQWED